MQYAVGGALAVAIHGAPRATKDFDLLVPADSIDAVIAAAKRCGFSFIAQPMTFSASGISITRVSKMIDAIHWHST